VILAVLLLLETTAGLDSDGAIWRGAETEVVLSFGGRAVLAFATDVDATFARGLATINEELDNVFEAVTETFAGAFAPPVSIIVLVVAGDICSHVLLEVDNAFFLLPNVSDLLLEAVTELG